MNETPITIKRALISVSDKTGLIDFARALHELNIEIISTGGTSKLLRDADVPVLDVADITQFPEMMDGRLKTLHPKIHGGILGLRDTHAATAMAHAIGWIDLVIVNLYPFAATIKNAAATYDNAIENIDIGGPTMIRAAAKNQGWVGVIVEPLDYEKVLVELRTTNSLSFAMRKQLATKAFGHTAAYDALIFDYLEKKTVPDTVPPTLQLTKFADLRYGENPHQTASAYSLNNHGHGILQAKQHQGKQLSYNNITDADAALACVQEFTAPACVVVKHANPCGAAVAATLAEAFTNAFNADKTAAFGGIIALNRPCDKTIADAIAQVFIEVLIAPAYTAEALAVLASKPNLRVLEVTADQAAAQEFKFVTGGVLIQDKDLATIERADLQVVTSKQPTATETDAMLFSWRVLKHIKSNAILIANTTHTLGIGAGQVARIDAVEIALRKAAGKTQDAVLASDAFFPFRDSIDRLANSGIGAVIQPGGSVKDAEVIAACNELGIAMVFTGKRCFKH
ncbi:MAG: bifunctional phosphoribosylaminoimidazolecarboxamide formyltransferase/IMP cyclohydrolase [Pseudomonadota bacterium]